VSIKEEYNQLVQSAINKNNDIAIEQEEFCNGRSGVYKVFENDKVKVIYSFINQSCEVRRKENHNPVFCRDKNGVVYRIHGEFGRIKDELVKLAGQN
jgi:hypothetical protein